MGKSISKVSLFKPRYVTKSTEGELENSGGLGCHFEQHYFILFGSLMKSKYRTIGHFLLRIFIKQITNINVSWSLHSWHPHCLFLNTEGGEPQENYTQKVQLQLQMYTHNVAHVCFHQAPHRGMLKHHSLGDSIKIHYH